MYQGVTYLIYYIKLIYVCTSRIKWCEPGYMCCTLTLTPNVKSKIPKKTNHQITKSCLPACPFEPVEV
jgi:hypothetical protein